MKHAIRILVTFLAVCPAFGVEIPPELERLNAQRARQISEIDKVYISQLELLKTKYTKAGNLEAANQVVEILKKLQPVAKVWFLGTRWRLDDIEITISDDAVKHSNFDRPFKYEMVGDSGLIYQALLRKITLRFDNTLKTGTFSDNNGGSGKLIRIKE